MSRRFTSARVTLPKTRSESSKHGSSLSREHPSEALEVLPAVRAIANLLGPHGADDVRPEPHRSLLHHRDGRSVEESAIATLTDSHGEALGQLKRRIGRYLAIGRATDRDVAEPRSMRRPSCCVSLNPIAATMGRRSMRLSWSYSNERVFLPRSATVFSGIAARLPFTRSSTSTLASSVALTFHFGLPSNA